MKQTIFFLVATISTALFAEPVHSMLGAEGGSMVQTDRHDFPDGIVAVEFLESTGTQWIITGINPKYSTSWSADIVCLPSDNYSVFFMSLFGYSYNTLGVQSVGITRRKWAQTSISVDYVNPTQVHADQSGQYFNGIKGNSNNIGNGLFYLFNRTYFTDQYPWQGRVYSAQFWIDGVLARDLLPVRFLNENDEWEGAMYDLVSGDLFVNAGSGSFLIGPDVEE